MKISVIINTYNASKHLKQVLEAVKGFDEIVICDMESTDNTIEIAKTFNCKIVTLGACSRRRRSGARAIKRISL